MKNKNSFLVFGVCLSLAILFPDFAHAGLEGSLEGLKYKLTGVILPLLAVMGIALSALSLFTGNPNAKQHIAYAILGCIFGFGAQAIVDFIAQTVR
ncbi:MAG: TrbC/VirB2 family protein [Pseudomonadota bacterium]|nr:TrbC/VirB2 family protein [Pseudomonadota bacterium]